MADFIDCTVEGKIARDMFVKVCSNGLTLYKGTIVYEKLDERAEKTFSKYMSFQMFTDDPKVGKIKADDKVTGSFFISDEKNKDGDLATTVTMTELVKKK